MQKDMHTDLRLPPTSSVCMCSPPVTGGASISGFVVCMPQLMYAETGRVPPSLLLRVQDCVARRGRRKIYQVTFSTQGLRMDCISAHSCYRERHIAHGLFLLSMFRCLTSCFAEWLALLLSECWCWVFFILCVCVCVCVCCCCFCGSVLCGGFEDLYIYESLWVRLCCECARAFCSFSTCVALLLLP